MTVPAYRLSPRGEFRHTSEHAQVEANFDDALDVEVLDTSDTAAGGSVSHSAADGHIVCVVSTGGSDRAIVRSHARPRAPAGSWRSTRIAAKLTGTITNQVKRWGIGDDNDGAFFELDGETLSTVRRSSVSGSPVEVRKASAYWNVAAITAITLSNEHLWEIRDAWPTGDIEFCLDGQVVHQESVDGSINAPAWKRARLPLLLECVNTAVTSSGGSLDVSHASISTGGQPLAASAHCVQARDAAVGVTQTGLVAIQPKATFGSVANRAELRAARLSVYAGAEVLVELIRGATLGGALSSHAATSRAESGTAPGTITGGTVVAAFSLSGFASVELRDVVRLLADGTQQTLTVAATAITGTAAVSAALSWEEIP